MPRKNPAAVTIAVRLIQHHASPSDDPDTHSAAFDSLALQLARAVLRLPTAATMGRKGGKVRSDAKAEAARLNGKRGGRPRKHWTKESDPP